MSFLAPDRLVFLLLPAGALVWYALALTRRKRHAVRFSDVELFDRVAPDRPGLRRHVAAAALVVALVAVVVSFARPVTAVSVPREQATLVLAIDVSLSMDAGDVAPSRIEAAKEAALRFLELAPEELDVGVVAFAGVALPAVVPTTDRSATAAAVRSLTLAEGTAVGEAIFASLTLLGDHRDAPAAVVVLSDGETTVGRPETEAVGAAIASGVPVSTVSFGTAEGTIVFSGEAVPVPVDTGALRQVAEDTGGSFTEAASAGELQGILDDIGSGIGLEEEHRELWEFFLAGGIVALVAAAAMSLMWFSRLP